MYFYVFVIKNIENRNKLRNKCQQFHQINKITCQITPLSIHFTEKLFSFSVTHKYRQKEKERKRQALEYITQKKLPPVNIRLIIIFTPILMIVSHGIQPHLGK